MKEVLIICVVVFLPLVLAEVSFFQGDSGKDYFISGERAVVENDSDDESFEGVDMESGVGSDVDEGNAIFSINSENEREFFLFDYRSDGVYLKSVYRYVLLGISLVLLLIVFLKLNPSGGLK